MNSLENYLKSSIDLAKKSVYIENKENNTISKGIVLIKVLNSLKAECNDLNDIKETLSKEDEFARADTIQKLTKIIENFDWVDKIIQENYSEKIKKEKMENER